MKIASNIKEMIICEIKSFILKYRFINKYKDAKNKDILNFVKKKIKLVIFPYDFTKKYKSKDIKIYKEDNTYYYLINNQKMYLKKSIKFKLHAKRYIKNLLLEQDIESPHLYLNKEFNIDNNSILLDIGGAEGIFTLMNIDKIKHAYIFECNEDWLEALNKTFKNNNKVTIINKKISNINNDDTITIDKFIKDYKIKNIDFIKIDIEGYEENALLGSTNTIKKYKPKMAICCYHTPDQEKNIKELLKNDYNIKTSNKYMIYYYDYNIEDNYLRHGVLRCTHK